MLEKCTTKGEDQMTRIEIVTGAAMLLVLLGAGLGLAEKPRSEPPTEVMR